MRVFIGLLLASIATPVVVFLLISVTGLIFTITEYINTGTGLEYLGGGAIGGSAYAIGAAFVSIPSTFMFGYPLTYIAINKGKLTSPYVLIGATLSGAVAVALATTLFLTKVTSGLITFSLIIGAVGGFLNGATFRHYMNKPNKSLNLTGAENAPPS